MCSLFEPVFHFDLILPQNISPAAFPAGPDVLHPTADMKLKSTFKHRKLRFTMEYICVMKITEYYLDFAIYEGVGLYVNEDVSQLVQLLI